MTSQTVFEHQIGARRGKSGTRVPQWGAVLDQIFAFVGITSLDGILLQANEAPSIAAGIAAEDVLGKPFWDAYWWSFSSAEQARLQDAMERAAQGETVRYDAVIRVVNDGRATIDFQVAPLRDSSGRIVNLVPSAVDVSDRVRTERAQSEANRRFEATFEQAAVGIGHVAPDGRFIRVNQRYSDITGFSRAELMEGGFQRITHPDDLDADLAHVQRLLAGESSSYSMQKRYIRKDGSVVWVTLTVSLVRTDDGSPDFFVAVVEDISERKRAEEDETRAQHALLEALTAKDTLLYEVNHRVKNSLQLVTSLMLLEASKVTNEEARAAVMSARQQVSLVAKLHQRLYSEGAHDRVDFCGFLRELVSSFAAFPTSCLNIEVAVISEELRSLPIRIAAPLAMVTNELITNAAKHAYPGGEGRIEVELAAIGDLAQLRIVDHGVGLPPAFDVETAPGLGFRVVLGLVSQLGGNLKVSSESGTQVTVTVPFTESSHGKR